MNVFLYIMIFIAGTVFGSFFSLAVYRLPRREDITHVRSHCTSCNHKLELIDLIPVFSYIFLRGRCRYCKEKIRSRYILLEIFSGLVFLLIAFALNINDSSTIYEFINLFLIYLFVVMLFIIGGIDKEQKIIHQGTLLYGFIVSIVYVIFHAVRGEDFLDNIIGGILISIIMLTVNALLKNILKENELPVGFGDILYIAVIGFFFGFGLQVLSIIIALFMVALVMILKKQKEAPFGFYLSISSAIVIIGISYLEPISEVINSSVFELLLA